ncbi:MAG: signal peptidase I [Oligoflexia bacterium]|nr:signal peptidase I [Oligoflexia bacterium]
MADTSPSNTGSSPKGPTIETARNDFSEILSFLKTLALFLAAAFILRASVVEAFKIPSLSMYPTLKEGDHILVSKLSYGFRLPLITNSIFGFAEPHRGDIVVFTRPDDPRSPEDDSAINIIKRVIGLPGEKVEVRETKVYINDVPLDEPYAHYDFDGIPDGNFGPAVIPAGHIFLMGDNRDHSKDSRFWTYPFLDISRVKGRALIIYWSWAGLSRIGTLLR